MFAGVQALVGRVSMLPLDDRSIRSASCLSRIVLATVNVLLTKNSQLTSMKPFCHSPMFMRHKPQAVKENAAANATHTVIFQEEVST